MFLKFCGVTLCLLVVISLTLKVTREIYVVSSYVDLDDSYSQFHDYLRKFNKNYEVSEYAKRYGIFQKSLKSIERLNRNRQFAGALYGLTKLTDLLPEELFQNSSRMFRSVLSEAVKCSTQNGRNYSEPILDGFMEYHLKFDWRTVGVVSPVVDQKICRACWACSIVGVMETMAAINKKWDIHNPLSIQELIDCSDSNNGCQGGHIEKALLSLCKPREGKLMALAPQSLYPLTLRHQDCQFHVLAGVTLAQFNLKSSIKEEDIIKTIANHGPVVVEVNAASWMYYINGVIDRNCPSNNRNHVVQIVGYDLTAEIPHYIVRDSYGTDHGENGYIRVAYGQNMCGIASNVASLDVDLQN